MKRGKKYISYVRYKLLTGGEPVDKAEGSYPVFLLGEKWEDTNTQSKGKI